MIPQNTLVPNLWLSINSRRNKINIITIKAVSRSRIGVTKTGSTWSGGAYRRYKKLFVFSIRATLELIKNK
jgi:hypothetical protein